MTKNVNVFYKGTVCLINHSCLFLDFVSPIECIMCNIICFVQLEITVNVTVYMIANVNVLFTAHKFAHINASARLKNIYNFQVWSTILISFFVHFSVCSWNSDPTIFHLSLLLLASPFIVLHELHDRNQAGKMTLKVGQYLKGLNSVESPTHTHQFDSTNVPRCHCLLSAYWRAASAPLLWCCNWPWLPACQPGGLQIKKKQR